MVRALRNTLLHLFKKDAPARALYDRGIIVAHVFPEDSMDHNNLNEGIWFHVGDGNLKTGSDPIVQRWSGTCLKF